MLDRASAEERDSRTVLAMQLSQSTKEKDLKVRDGELLFQKLFLLEFYFFETTDKTKVLSYQ